MRPATIMIAAAMPDTASATMAGASSTISATAAKATPCTTPLGDEHRRQPVAHRE